MELFFVTIARVPYRVTRQTDAQIDKELTSSPTTARSNSGAKCEGVRSRATFITV